MKTPSWVSPNTAHIPAIQAASVEALQLIIHQCHNGAAWQLARAELHRRSMVATAQAQFAPHTIH